MKVWLSLALCVAALCAPSAMTLADSADMVNPFIGTTYGGDTFPGPDYPFGMIQWGPDTTSQPSGGGYEYTDQRITGFSVTHLSGPGCPVMNDLGILPFSGNITDPAHASMAFTHVQEHASPGWYDVLLGDNMDVAVSMTSTLRTGLAAFRFPGQTPAHVIFNLGHSGTSVLEASMAFTGPRTFESSITSGGFCGMPGHYTVFIAGEFDTPFDAHGGAGNVMWADFGSAHRTVKLRVAISFVDADGARKNLRAEATSWDLNAVHERALAAWRGALAHASIAGGTDAQQHSFWTALYHSLLHPNVISDVDGRYPGFDAAVHTAARGHLEYGNWSGWDVYRTQLQLLGFLFPPEASDMVRSLLDAGDQMGWLPRWSLVNDETGVMNGDPGPSLIADAYFFGARGFDTRKALRAMVHGASASNTPSGQGWYQERNDIEEYLSLGYVDSHRQNSVSHLPNGASETLEYAISDFAIASFARNLGDNGTYRTFLRRSGNWANLFSRRFDLIEPRDEQGRFDIRPSVNGEGDFGFQEGNAEQYSWVVPQDQRGLIRAHGGDAFAVEHLNRFFSALQEHDGDWGTPSIALNNEPSFGAPFLYLSAHAPAQTQRIVRLIETKYFDNAPGGEPGNDDLGAMSAMYLWEAAGLYPQTPGTASLDIASPLFTHVELRSEDGRRIVVDAPAARTDAPYVHGLRVNGRASSHTWVEVSRRGLLHLQFDLSSTPSLWGSKSGDEPPSFDGGIRPPAASTPVIEKTVAKTMPPSVPARRLQAPFGVTYFDGSVFPLNIVSYIENFTLGERVPDALAIPDSTLIALASIYTDSIAIVNRRGNPVTRVKTGSNPAALAISPDGKTLWAALRGADAVQPIDLATMKAGTPIPAGAHPIAIAMDPGGKELYVADQNAKAVSIVDIAQAKTVATVTVGWGPSALAIGPGNTLYVADAFSNDVTVVDLRTRAAIARISAGFFPRAFALAGSRMYVANWAGGTVSVIDTGTRAVVQTIRTGLQPAALAASPDGKTIYIALAGENGFQTIDTATAAVSAVTNTPGSSLRTVRFP